MVTVALPAVLSWDEIGYNDTLAVLLWFWYPEPAFDITKSLALPPTASIKP